MIVKVSIDFLKTPHYLAEVVKKNSFVQYCISALIDTTQNPFFPNFSQEKKNRFKSTPLNPLKSLFFETFQLGVVSF